MRDRPSNQWLYSELPTEKRPGPFLSRVPCSHDGMEPAGKTSFCNFLILALSKIHIKRFRNRFCVTVKQRPQQETVGK